MGLGILEDNNLEHVPGTAPLSDRNGDEEYTSQMKHGSGKDKDIILVPQPSDSPRDPLNWPLWKRDLIFFILCSCSAIANAWSFMLAPGYGLLAQDFGIVIYSHV